MKVNKQSPQNNVVEQPLSPSTSPVLFGDLDNFFDYCISHRWPRLIEWNSPKVDILDHDNEIEVQAALPGVKKEDLEVSINNQTITIRTTTKEEKKEEGKYFRREISHGEFQRTLSLPGNIDSDNVKASFKEGILKITISKIEKSQSKIIEIK